VECILLWFVIGDVILFCCEYGIQGVVECILLWFVTLYRNCNWGCFGSGVVEYILLLFDGRFVSG